jgi:hypothetical protein
VWREKFGVLASIAVPICPSHQFCCDVRRQLIERQVVAADQLTEFADRAQGNIDP